MKKHLTAFLLIGIVSCVVYFNSLENEFVFDDIDQVVEKYEIRSLRNIPAILGLTNGRPSYRPVRTLSYCIDYFFSNLNPVAYHISNIIYHILASLFLYLIVIQLSNNQRMAIFAGILFAIHPINTDAVTYISGRRDVLSSLFYLMGFYFFMRFRVTGYQKYMIFALLVYLLGLFTKEMVVTLPLIFLLYDFSFNTDKKNILIKKYKYQYLLFFSIGGLFTYYAMSIYPSAIIKAEKAGVLSYNGESDYLNFLTAVRIWCFYIKLLLFPITLNADYSFNAFPISKSFFEIRTIISFIFLSAAGYLIFKYRYIKITSFSALWFFITLLPVSRIIPHHEMVAEHYLYLPSAGFCILIAWLFEKALHFSRARIVIYVVLVSIAMLLATRTVARNRDWKDQFTLWGKTVKTAPDCARAHNNFGGFLQKRGNINEAVGEFKKSLGIAPDYYLAHHNLGFCYYLQEGWSERVQQEFDKCLRANPNYELAHFNLGWFHHRDGRLEEAEMEYKKALKLNPAFINAMLNLCNIYYFKGRYNKAKELYQKVIEINPDNLLAHMRLANLYEKIGMKDKALEEEKRVLELTKKSNH